MSWQATVLTIFPEMLPGPLAHSLAGKALAAGIWQLETVDIRDFARDKHRSVDDAPFGGGPGMVMRPDVLDSAIAGAGGIGPLILLSPRGRVLDQQRVRAFAAGPGMRLICGRFEGVDDRNQAEALRGLRLYLSRSALPPTDDEEYYHADLIGLEAALGDGTPLGHVRAVHDFGAGDTLEIARPAGPPVLVPFTRAIVPVVDLAAGRLVIDPPPGLLEPIVEEERA